MWTLLQSEEKKLEAFRMSCQHRILGVRWYDFVPNTVIAQRTGQDSLLSSMRLFGEIGGATLEGAGSKY